MEKEKFEKAMEIDSAIRRLKNNFDGRMSLPDKVDSEREASTVIYSLYEIYTEDIKTFCEGLVKLHKEEREKRIEELEKEFEEL